MDEKLLEVDWYGIIGCSISSTRSEIEKAVRKLSLKYHSDKTNDPDALSKFLEIQKAKETLLDDEKRKFIDEKLKAKLKRKEHELKKSNEMNESRKKMKEKLEKSMKDVEKNIIIKPAAESDFNSKTQKFQDEKTLNHLRQNASSHMEKLARETEEKLARQTSDYLNHLKSLNRDKSVDIKIKWKRSSESHSEESIYQMLKRFGPIENIKLGEKGTSAIVSFQESTTAKSCFEAYESSEEFKVSIISNDKKRSEPSIYTYDYQQNSKANNSNYQTSDTMLESKKSESELLGIMRKVVEKEKLRQLFPDTIKSSTMSKLDQEINGENHSMKQDALQPSGTAGTAGTAKTIQPVIASVTLNMEEDILLRMKRKQLELRQKQLVTESANMTTTL